MKKIHLLKTWPEYFEQIFMGRKTFEVRKNDRDFNTGDTLILKEWNPQSGEYTGRELARGVGFILHGNSFGIEEGYCVMSLL